MAEPPPGGYPLAVARPESTLEALRAAARLTRLELSRAQEQRLVGDFQAFLTAFEALARAEVAGLEPYLPSEEFACELRADEPLPSPPPDLFLERAPRVEKGCYRLPKGNP